MGVAAKGGCVRVSTRKARNFHDKAFLFRRQANQTLLDNDSRADFRNAIASLFGGEKNIPKNVKKAMALGDYD